MADWTDTTHGYPDPDEPVSVQTAEGEVPATMRLFDESDWPDGAYWETDTGERLELGDVTRWKAR